MIVRAGTPKRMIGWWRRRRIDCLAAVGCPVRRPAASLNEFARGARLSVLLNLGPLVGVKAMNDRRDETPYVIVEKRGLGLGAFLGGAIAGALVALLYTPRTGEETKQEIREGLLRLREDADSRFGQLRSEVEERYDRVREEVGERIELARGDVKHRKFQAEEAVKAGREAARKAREDLEKRVAESKDTYRKSVSELADAAEVDVEDMKEAVEEAVED